MFEGYEGITVVHFRHGTAGATATWKSRQAKDEAPARELEQTFIGKKALEWEQHLAAADIACVQGEERSPYHFFAEDLHVGENGFTTEVKSSRWGSFWRYSPLIRFSHMENNVGASPLKGEQTGTELGEPGYSEEEGGS